MSLVYREPEERVWGKPTTRDGVGPIHRGEDNNDDDDDDDDVGTAPKGEDERTQIKSSQWSSRLADGVEAADLLTLTAQRLYGGPENDRR